MCPLRARDLEVSLGDRPVLRGTSLELGAGEVLAVLGPSGAGKTTLFRCLVGDLLPQRGGVELAGVDVSREPLWRRARRGLGYIPQTPSVLFELTVEDNLRCFASAAAVEMELDRWLLQADLKSRRAVRAGELSGGERRRLEVIRALIPKPSVLVCDEPLSGIDPASAARVADLLRERARAGGAIVLADHRIPEALALADRALLLVEGSVVSDGPAGDFTQRPEVRACLLPPDPLQPRETSTS